MHGFIRCNRKAVPVENGPIGGLLNIQLMWIDLLNVGVPTDHVAIARESHNQARQEKLQ